MVTINSKEIINILWVKNEKIFYTKNIPGPLSPVRKTLPSRNITALKNFQIFGKDLTNQVKVKVIELKKNLKIKIGMMCDNIVI